MRSLVTNLYKNPSLRLIGLSLFFIIFIILWYFLFYKGLSQNYEISKDLENDVSKELKKYKTMQTKINNMEKSWNELNNDFQYQINRIPDKRLYEAVNDYLYSSIIDYELKIINFSPSNIPIQKENIFIPELGQNITVEKIPIDISLKGSFIDFNQFFEQLMQKEYKFTSSDVEIVQSSTAAEQTINLIAYAYFQSSKKTLKKRSLKIEKNQPTKTKNKITQTKQKKDKKVNTIADANVVLNNDMDNIPEMWLEPATEPIENFKEQQKETEDKTSLADKNKEVTNEPGSDVKSIEEANSKVKSDKLEQEFKNYNILNDLVVLDSKMCKKVKNNLPVYTSKTFSGEDEKVICYSIINNNTKKSKDIYHIWYMDGQLKAKVRIRVRSGKEILAISNRKVDDLDKGDWKVEITDINKKILDTVIFEVV
tara:strand:+ start:718 stop:1992 length:1275 start_codon:yes stop_codon:yes gene_type:complete